MTSAGARLAAAVIALTAIVCLLAGVDRAGNRHVAQQTDVAAAVDTAPPPGPVATASALPAPRYLWTEAGAFVWHETALDPEILGRRLRASGFGWAAVLVHDGLADDPVEADWVRRFRAASELQVGAWGVLREEPEREAELASELVEHYDFDFYIANAEAEYKYSGPDGFDGERFGRSQRFIEAFRSLRGNLPAALSSYCRADRQDIDWKAWRAADFAFLPQAYANDFGAEATPAACASGAQGFFRLAEVHPTIGTYSAQHGRPDAAEYIALLRDAGTLGFSVYLAENEITEDDWHELGKAIDQLTTPQTMRPGDTPTGEPEPDPAPERSGLPASWHRMSSGSGAFG